MRAGILFGGTPLFWVHCLPIYVYYVVIIYRYNSNIIEIVTTGSYQDNDEEKLLRTDIRYMGTLFFVCFGYIYITYINYISV